MARRPWGSGTEFQRADGQWVVRLPRPDGTMVTGTSRQSLAAARARARGKLRASPSTSSSDETTGDYLARWLDDTAPHRLAPRTLALYRAIVDGWLIPHLGTVPLTRLHPDHVERMVNAVLDAGRSPQWAKHCHTVLRSALKDAVRRGTITDNPAARIEPVKVPRTEVVRLSGADVRKVLAANPDHPHRAIWIIALTVGMRRGEVLSLRWGDIDLERGTVTVAGTVLPVKPETRKDGKRARRTRWAFVEPKTPTSRRTLFLSQTAIAALRRHRETFPPVKAPWFVFRRSDGAPLSPDWILRRWQKALEGVGLPPLPFHSSRHTAAALMLDDSGGDLRLVSQTLGHASLGQTIDRYGGIAARAMQKSADAMDRLLEEPAKAKEDVG
jgi:integrase